MAIFIYMKCPKCGYENPDEAPSCELCSGLLKQSDAAIPETISQKELSLPIKETKKFPTAIIIFFAGLILYPLVHSICLLDLMCCYFTVLVHELGHCLMFLAFGQFALPKLDFVYGGGMAVPIFSGANKGPILIIMLLIWLIYVNRKNSRLMIFLIVIAVIYPFLAFSKGQDVLVSAAGHLCEVVAAVICFYRCLVAGNTLNFERPIYAVLGWWITIHGIIFFLRLATNMTARAEYIHDPGYAVKYNDLVRITDKTGWDFGFVAIMFMLCYVIPIILGILFVYLSATTYSKQPSEEAVT